MINCSFRNMPRFVKVSAITKKYWFCLFAIFIIILTIASCSIGGRRQNDQIDLETRIQLNYFVNFWRFESHFGWDEIMWFDVNNIRNRELVFVHSEEAAAVHGFPLDKVIAFPSACTWGALNELNNMELNFILMEENGICLDELGLSFPFTIEDITYNWVNMEVFILGALTPNERTAVRSHPNAHQYRRETLDNRILRDLLFPGRLDAINEIITGRDINNVDIEHINNSHGTSFTATDLPAPPFTEDDVKSNPRLFRSIINQLLVGNELRSIRPEEILRRQLEQND